MQQVVDLVTSNYSDSLFKYTEASANLAQMAIGGMRGKIVAVFDTEYAAYYNPSLGIIPYADYAPGVPQPQDL